MPVEEPRSPPKSIMKDKTVDFAVSSVGDVSMVSGLSKMIKRQTALAIKREIKKGELTLREMIQMFYEMEE